MITNFGLCRIHGSMPADKCLILIKNKLEEFGIFFKNIVSITTDGASVMKKVIKIIDVNVNHQLCLAHGIQLAVIKVLYSKNNLEEIEDEEPVKLPDTDDCENSDCDNDEDDDDENDEVLQIGQDMSIGSQLNSVKNLQLSSLIAKIRKVVKMFRKSTKNDDILQKHVKEEFGKELSLILDSKTRWNSLLNMLERFSTIQNCVRKSLIDLKLNITFTDNELTLLSNTILALQPIKIAVETLCSQTTNLYIADVT